MGIISTNQTDIPAWMVWSDNVSGNKNLNAICLERERANTYRKTIAAEHGVIRAWVEETRVNHLYASLFQIPSNESIHNLAKQLASVYRYET